MRVLVTGGAGFIGSHFVEALTDRAQELRVLDNLATGSLSNLAQCQHSFLEGSICDRNLVDKAMEGIEMVLHCAALSSVPDCIAQPGRCLDTNITGLETVLSAAAKHKVKQFAFLSSAAVYGSSPLIPTSEDCPLSPTNPYANSKAQGEELLRKYSTTGGMNAKAFRLFNVYGPRQKPNDGYSAAIPRFVSQALKHRPITIHGDGKQTRDFVFVTDVITAILQTLENPNLQGPVNVGTGSPISILALIHEIISVTSSGSPILFESQREGDANHSCATVGYLASLGWKPTTTLSMGLRATIDWQQPAYPMEGCSL